MNRRSGWVPVVLALALLPGCIVINQPPAEPAPPPAQQPPPAPQQPPPQPPPPPDPVPPPAQQPPPQQPPPPPPQEELPPFGVSSVSVRVFAPVSIQGRSKAVDQGSGGTLELDDDLDVGLSPVYELRGTGTTAEGDDFSVRFTALSMHGDGTLKGPRNHGGNSYPAGTTLESRMEWYYLDIQSDEAFGGTDERGGVRLGAGVGFWWLGLEVGEDSMDSGAFVIGPSATVTIKPAPMWELGGEATARAGPAFPFPGIAGEASLAGWVGLNLEDRFIFRLGYRGRAVGSRTTNVSLHFDSSSGSIDKNDTKERDRLGFEIHGPFLEIEFRF